MASVVVKCETCDTTVMTDGEAPRRLLHFAPDGHILDFAEPPPTEPLSPKTLYARSLLTDDEQREMWTDGRRPIAGLTHTHQLLRSEHPTRTHAAFAESVAERGNRIVAVRDLGDGWTRWVTTCPLPGFRVRDDEATTDTEFVEAFL